MIDKITFIGKMRSKNLLQHSIQIDTFRMRNSRWIHISAFEKPFLVVKFYVHCLRQLVFTHFEWKAAKKIRVINYQDIRNHKNLGCCKYFLGKSAHIEVLTKSLVLRHRQFSLFSLLFFIENKLLRKINTLMHLKWSNRTHTHTHIHI